jgi:hypothetical protein
LSEEVMPSICSPWRCRWDRTWLTRWCVAWWGWRFGAERIKQKRGATQRWAWVAQIVLARLSQFASILSPWNGTGWIRRLRWWIAAWLLIGKCVETKKQLVRHLSLRRYGEGGDRHSMQIITVSPFLMQSFSKQQTTHLWRWWYTRLMRWNCGGCVAGRRAVDIESSQVNV